MAEGLDRHHIFKLLVIGDTRVGKSCLFWRYYRGEFREPCRPTIGVEFATKRIELEGHSIKLELWDTGGQERYRPIITSYFRGAHGCILVYDTTNEASFLNLDTYMDLIKQHGWDSWRTVLVGNKSDLEDARQVSFEEGKKYAQDHGLTFLEASAKDDECVEMAFIKLASELLDARKLQ